MILAFFAAGRGAWCNMDRSKRGRGLDASVRPRARRPGCVFTTCASSGLLAYKSHREQAQAARRASGGHLHRRRGPRFVPHGQLQPQPVPWLALHPLARADSCVVLRARLRPPGPRSRRTWTRTRSSPACNKNSWTRKRGSARWQQSARNCATWRLICTKACGVCWNERVWRSHFSSRTRQSRACRGACAGAGSCTAEDARRVGSFATDGAGVLLAWVFSEFFSP